jgi:hypothetical protein
MQSRGRPKGTHERTARWYARLWFDLSMIKKNHRGRRLKPLETVKVLQDSYPRRYRTMSAKSLREYLTSPPFAGLSLEEAVRFSIIFIVRAGSFHIAMHRLLNKPAPSREEFARLLSNLAELQYQPLAKKYGIPVSYAESLVKNGLGSLMRNAVHPNH